MIELTVKYVRGVVLRLVPLLVICCSGNGGGSPDVVPLPPEVECTSCAEGKPVKLINPTCAPAGTPLELTEIAVTVDDAKELAVGATHLFWLDPAGKRVMWVPKEGGSAAEFAATPSKPVSLAVDEYNVYWTTRAVGNEPGSIFRSPLSGSGEAEEVASGVSIAGALTLDSCNLYWIERKSNKEAVQRVLKHGDGSIETLDAPAVVEELALADGNLLLVGHTPDDAVSAISAVPPCGGEPASITSDGYEEIEQAAVGSDHLYFVVGNAISRVPLAGGQRSLVGTTSAAISGLTWHDGMLYYESGHTIWVLADSGGSARQLLTSVNSTGNFRADGGSLYWIDVEDGQTSLVGLALDCEGSGAVVPGGYGHTFRGTCWPESDEGLPVYAAVVGFDRQSILHTGSSLVVNGKWSIQFDGLEPNSLVYVVWYLDRDGDGLPEGPGEALHGYGVDTGDAGKGNSTAVRPNDPGESAPQAAGLMGTAQFPAPASLEVSVPPHALFLHDSQLLAVDAGEQSDLWTFTSERNIRGLYVNGTALMGTQPAGMKNLIDDAVGFCMGGEVLYADPTGFPGSILPGAVSRLEELLGHMAGWTGDVTTTGVTYDIRIHETPEWVEEQQKVVDDYLATLAELRAGTAVAGLRFSVMIPSSFEQEMVTISGASAPLSQGVADLVDRVVLLVSGSTVDAVVAQAGPSVTRATELGAAVVVVLDTRCGGEPADTFCGENQAALHEVIAGVRESFASEPGFESVAVEGYRSYSDL